MEVGPNGHPGQSAKEFVAKECRNEPGCVIAQLPSTVEGHALDLQYKSKTVLHLVLVSLNPLLISFNNAYYTVRFFKWILRNLYFKQK